MVNKVHKKYLAVQLLKLEEKVVEPSRINDLGDNWKDDQIPMLQRRVVDIQLDNMKKGIIDPVFSSLSKALKMVKLQTFHLLDIGCATGYYFEVIKALDKRHIVYKGCDYSAAMIKIAKKYYSDVEFEIQDATALNYPDKSFDVVMISGILEHIPNYLEAINNALRVSKHYAIFHRLPLIPRLENEYTIGSQYTIEVSRIYFSREKIINEINKQGFSLVKDIATYSLGANLGTMKNLYRKIKGLLPSERSTRTLVFRRVTEKLGITVESD